MVWTNEQRQKYPYLATVLRLQRLVIQSMSRPLTAVEVQAHPEFPHVHWKLKAEREGRVGVAAGRGGPFELAYELHGHGPSRIIWIMGLGGFMKTW